jgi:hypothetical protein
MCNLTKQKMAQGLKTLYRILMTGKTIAFKRFKLLIRRTNSLIEVCQKGIDHKIKISESIVNKLNVKGIPGKFPKGYKSDVQVTKKHPDGSISLAMDDRSAHLIKKAMLDAKKITEELNNHLYSIMLAYVWGSFETYLIMLFEQLYKNKPEMLKSSTTISFKDVIENEKNIINYVLDKELESIGHFSIENYLDYLNRKINLAFTDSVQNHLRQTYLLRNIISHNTGIVNNRLKNKIPAGIKIKNNELLLSVTYLKKEISFISSTVNKIERHVTKKFKNAV